MLAYAYAQCYNMREQHYRVRWAMKQQKMFVLSIIILAVALIVFAAACTNIQDSSTITYMADGKEYATITLFGNETPSAPADPEKTGYTFAGWFTDETFETPFDFEAYAATLDRTDIIVYAKFEGYLSYEKNDDGGYTVTGLTVKTLPIADIVIPDTYNGLPVTAIGDMAFELNPIITSVTLGKNVTEIEPYAFKGCELLQTVTLNDGLQKIDRNAFAASALTEIPALPASLTYLGIYAFAETNITSLTIPDT